MWKSVQLVRVSPLVLINHSNTPADAIQTWMSAGNSYPHSSCCRKVPYFKGITYFFRKRDTTCHSGDGVFDTICEVSLYIYAIITSNMFEAILLYFCIKAIEKQNDAAQELIGQDQYRKRRRYSKIVFNLGYFLTKNSVRFLHWLFKHNRKFFM